MNETNSHGGAIRVDLGAVPCGLRATGDTRQRAMLDVFEVHDTEREKHYLYLRANDIEIRLTERQADILSAIIE